MSADPARVAAELRTLAEQYAATAVTKAEHEKAERYRKAADLHDTIVTAQKPRTA